MSGNTSFQPSVHKDTTQNGDVATIAPSSTAVAEPNNATQSASANIPTPSTAAMTIKTNNNKRAAARSTALAMKIKSSVAASVGRSPAVSLLRVPARSGDNSLPAKASQPKEEEDSCNNRSSAKAARMAKPESAKGNKKPSGSVSTHLTKFIVPPEILRFNSDSPEVHHRFNSTSPSNGMTPLASLSTFGGASGTVLGSMSGGLGLMGSPAPQATSTTSPLAAHQDATTLGIAFIGTSHVQEPKRATSPHNISEANPIRICVASNIQLTATEMSALEANGITVLSEKYIMDEQRRIAAEVRAELEKMLTNNGVGSAANAMSNQQGISENKPASNDSTAPKKPTGPRVEKQILEPPEEIHYLWTEIERQYQTFSAATQSLASQPVDSPQLLSPTTVTSPTSGLRRKRYISAAQRQSLMDRLQLVLLPPRLQKTKNGKGIVANVEMMQGEDELESASRRYSDAIRYFFAPVRYIVADVELEPTPLVLAALPFAISVVKRSWLSNIVERIVPKATTVTTQATAQLSAAAATSGDSDRRRAAAVSALATAVAAKKKSEGQKTHSTSYSSRWSPRHPNLSLDAFKDPRASKRSTLSILYDCPSVTRPLQMHQPRQRQGLLVPLRFWVHPQCIMDGFPGSEDTTNNASKVTPLIDIRAVILSSGGSLVSDPLMGDANVLVFPVLPRGMKQYVWGGSARDGGENEQGGRDGEDDEAGGLSDDEEHEEETKPAVGRKRPRNGKSSADSGSTSSSVPSLRLPSYEGRLPTLIRNTLSNSLAAVADLHPSAKLRRRGTASAFRQWCLEQLDHHNAAKQGTPHVLSPNFTSPTAPYSILNPTDEPKDSALMCRVLGMCIPQQVAAAVLKQSRALPLCSLR